MPNKNIKLNFLHICEDAFATQEGGKLCIIKIFNRLTAKKFPALTPHIIVVANITFEKMGNYKGVVSIEKSTGEKIADYTSSFDVPRDEAEINFISRFFNIPFEQPDDYRVKIFVNEQKLGEIKLIVKSL
ncbi:MAG: hypothetical protein V1819_00830 [bacterium]